jgi:drug/metabolite transporter (DMT)-like permease
MDVLFGMLSAISNSFAAILSKDLTVRYPARQLIAPLLVLNVLLVVGLAPFVTWTWTPHVLLLHVVSAVLLAATSLAMFDLLAHGSASATVTAQALSPLPAALGVAVLLPGALDPFQVTGAIVVVAGVLYGLSDAFGPLGRRRTAATVLVAAASTGLLTVMGRVLADVEVGVIEAYLTRAALASMICLAVAPPRDIPLAAVPRMVPRAIFVSAQFLLILVAVQEGNPAVVQTAAATAPLFTVASEAIRTRRRPPARVVASAVVAAVGVGVVLLA